MLTGYAVPRFASAFHNFFSEEAVAFHGVVISLATAHLIFTKANHANSRMKCFGVLNRPVELCGFEFEHLILRSELDLLNHCLSDRVIIAIYYHLSSIYLR